MGQTIGSLFYGTPARASDTIHINELLLKLSVSNDEDRSEPPPQAVLLSLTIIHNISRTAGSDDQTYSIDYAATYKTLIGNLANAYYASLEALLDRVFDTVFESHLEAAQARAVATFRDTSPRFIVEATRRRDQIPSTGPYRFFIDGLAFSALIGVLPVECTAKQHVVFDIAVHRKQRTDLQELFPFFGLTTSIRRTFCASEYLTIEALASAVESHVLEYIKNTDSEVTVQLSKPNALPIAASPQVQLSWQRADFTAAYSPGIPTFKHVEMEPTKNSLSRFSHSVALALGSNLGDRFSNIEIALRLLEIPTSALSDLPKDAEVSVVDTGFMYETTPMYATDQPRFVNCACMVETNLSPAELLRLVKAIETAVGRVPDKRYGPHAVDLDILTYDDLLVDTRPPDHWATLNKLIGELVIPHPRLCEREFVLRPLNDMIPHFVHPARHKTIHTLLNEVVGTRNEDDGHMFKVMPFPKYPMDGAELMSVHGVQVPPTAKHWVVSPTYPSRRGRPRKTHIMAILNATPDSFSDAAQHNTVPTALEYVTTAVASGADIIDIGGYSTRPGSASVQSEEESWRVVPIIKTIREHHDEDIRNVLLSVDTFRWEVAEEAVRAGANCINDVYAFSGPTYPPDDASARHLAKMRSVARGLGVPVVLVHSRGEAGKNKDYSAYPGGLVPAIQAELGCKVDAIVRGRGGVRRWLVFVDPGIGFSKPVEGQLALMRDLSQVTAEGTGNVLAGYPSLFGASKKSVLGAVLGEGDVEGTGEGRKMTAQERGWATVAAVTCAVQQGASVVRVHDVPEMRDVVTVASAIWSQ